MKRKVTLIFYPLLEWNWNWNWSVLRPKTNFAQDVSSLCVSKRQQMENSDNVLANSQSHSHTSNQILKGR